MKVGNAAMKTINAEWTPVIAGTVSITATVGGQVKNYVDSNGKLVEIPEGGSVSRRTVMVQPVDEFDGYGDVRLEGTESHVEVVVTQENGAPVNPIAEDGVGIDYETGKITLPGDGAAATTDVNIAYSY